VLVLIGSGCGFTGDLIRPRPFRHDTTRTGEAEARGRLRHERRRVALLHRSRQFLLSDEFSKVKAGRRR